MGFHTANYNVYVALGDPKAAPLWKWKVWQRFLPAIDPLMKAARGTPAVRSTQFMAKLFVPLWADSRILRPCFLRPHWLSGSGILWWNGS